MFLDPNNWNESSFAKTNPLQKRPFASLRGVLDPNGPNDHFGQNDLFRTGFYLAFARPKWTKMVHF